MTDESYDQAMLFKLGQSWARLYNGLRSGGVPPDQAAMIVNEWIRVIHGRSDILDVDQGGPEEERLPGG